jgi:pimeloyl-ACP methyl ester carboxylesterase
MLASFNLEFSCVDMHSGLSALFPAAAASGQAVPPAIFTDAPADAAHPAKATVLRIPIHGVLINGIVFQPSGSGPHPTLVLCHGLPGNEKNLDLAQPVRRAGWNAVTLNYRGSSGSPGVSRFLQTFRGLPDIDYPFHDKIVAVTRCGRICLGRKKINFSTVFAVKRSASKKCTTTSGWSALWIMI